jgi:hypothetical protein
LDSKNSEKSMAMGVAVGIAIGAGIGAALGNLAIGVGVRIAIGAGIGGKWERDRSVESGDDDEKHHPTDIRCDRLRHRRWIPVDIRSVFGKLVLDSALGEMTTPKSQH